MHERLFIELNLERNNELQKLLLTLCLMRAVCLMAWIWLNCVRFLWVVIWEFIWLATAAMKNKTQWIIYLNEYNIRKQCKITYEYEINSIIERECNISLGFIWYFVLKSKFQLAHFDENRCHQTEYLIILL